MNPSAVAVSIISATIFFILLTFKFSDVYTLAKEMPQLVNAYLRPFMASLTNFKKRFVPLWEKILFCRLITVGVW